ncbi:MAG TPA: SufD family Fe-S cluster assembly protein [Acidimicrobiales bacterium]|nr:SufD family Fe-S cluster assembly protein [Acidimicrobiales bacterium]
MTLRSFTAEASAGLDGPDWLRERRARGYEAFVASPLPSESEEVWRYSPIDRLSLDELAPSAATAPSGAGQAMLADLAAAIGPVAGAVLVSDGRAGAFASADVAQGGGFDFGRAVDVPSAEAMLGSVQRGGDALVLLNDAFAPDPVFVDVPEGARLDRPVVVAHWCGGGGVVFPRTCVRAGVGARVAVVEVFAGAGADDPALVVPVTELSAAVGASLSYVSLQILGGAAWSIARLAARGAGGSTVRTFTVGLGAAYDRVRADVSVDGRDARSEILSAYLGVEDQVHDVRTLQDHAAPRTTSELLCQGAVAGRSRSVYSGLIRVHRGAVRSDARQTNHNLVLDEGAHADSVPNLDILENDVTCSHASTVGPVDEDQRYYIESRGVPPEAAEGLIVRGFFDAIIDRSPVPQATALLRREVRQRLELALGGAGDGGHRGGAGTDRVGAGV